MITESGVEFICDIRKRGATRFSRSNFIAIRNWFHQRFSFEIQVSLTSFKCNFLHDHDAPTMTLIKLIMPLKFASIKALQYLFLYARLD